MVRRSIVWFRSDLRLHDNQALTEALRCSDEVLCVYVFDIRVFTSKTKHGFPKTGTHRARFIIESIQALRESLAVSGADLIVRVGIPEDIIFQFARRLKTNWVFCNRERTGEEILVQDALERNLWSIGQEMRYERGKMLLYTQDLPFPVTQTPDSLAVFKREVEHFVRIRKPLPKPQIKQMSHSIDPGRIPSLADLGFETVVGSYDFVGGEKEALRKLDQIVASKDDDGSILDLTQPHAISPWISQGCLSPKLIYSLLVGSEFLDASNCIINSLLTRDYLRLMGKKYKDLIFTPGGPFGNGNPGAIGDVQEAHAWLSAQTGVDIVDACMQQLIQTGYLAHKGRSLVAQYLVNELNINWQIGAEFFESLLLDYDPCSNYGNWNQVAGVSPNGHRDRPLSIAGLTRLIDPDGSYVQRWLSGIMQS